ncbi:MAG: ferrous iron transport protein A [Clostridiales bacterium]|nr:ferrous iron transport protein A [Clostridiales bacterium]
MTKTLRDYRPGDKGVVAKVLAQGPLRRRIFDMGITPGAEITVRKMAPLGDPIEIVVRGYELSLRKADADTILMGDLV